MRTSLVTVLECGGGGKARGLLLTGGLVCALRVLRGVAALWCAQGELAEAQRAKFEAEAELTEIKGAFGKLEATVGTLRSTQEATARELIEYQVSGVGGDGAEGGPEACCPWVGVCAWGGKANCGWVGKGPACWLRPRSPSPLRPRSPSPPACDWPARVIHMPAQTKLREAQTSEAKQREKAAAFRQDAERAAQQLAAAQQDAQRAAEQLKAALAERERAAEQLAAARAEAGQGARELDALRAKAKQEAEQARAADLAALERATQQAAALRAELEGAKQELATTRAESLELRTVVEAAKARTYSYAVPHTLGREACSADQC